MEEVMKRNRDRDRDRNPLHVAHTEAAASSSITTIDMLNHSPSNQGVATVVMKNCDP